MMGTVRSGDIEESEEPFDCDGWFLPLWNGAFSSFTTAAATVSEAVVVKKL